MTVICTKCGALHIKDCICFMGDHAGVYLNSAESQKDLINEKNERIKELECALEECLLFINRLGDSEDFNFKVWDMFHDNIKKYAVMLGIKSDPRKESK